MQATTCPREEVVFKEIKTDSGRPQSLRHARVCVCCAHVHACVHAHTSHEAISRSLVSTGCDSIRQGPAFLLRDPGPHTVTQEGGGPGAADALSTSQMLTGAADCTSLALVENPRTASFSEALASSCPELLQEGGGGKAEPKRKGKVGT